MTEAVQNAYNHLHVSADEAIKMATTRVAAAIGMKEKVGKIGLGFPASFVEFDSNLATIKTLDFRE
ncbi:N-acetylglucosamine-6-phosphate deacetylase [compost metagenome]